MRKSLFVATLVAISALMTSRPGVTFGQGASAQVGTAVAVVDISEIFEGHVGFKQQMDAMQREVEQFEAQVRQWRTQLENLQGQLQAFQPGTPDYQRVTREITQLQTTMQVETTAKGEEFRTREAALYYQTYQEVVTVIDQFAQRNGIQLVLRFSSDDPNPSDPQSVLRLVNRPIVYQKNLNITYQILGILNPGAAAAPAGQGTR